MAGFIQLIKGLKFKNKKAAAFGCYGWSGEAVKIMNAMLQDAGLHLIDEGFRNQWNPNEGQLTKALEYGMKIAKA